MMNRFDELLNYSKWLFSLLLILLFSVLQGSEQSIFTIGFGSCAEQFREQAIWNKIAAHEPDLFVLSGDNVYIDSDKVEKMQSSYEQLSNNPNFSAFRSATPIIGTWDDHDYGLGDGGKEFSAKQDSKNAFINFFNYRELNELRNKDRGIFHTKWYDFNNKKIQIIILDTRWYRDPLLKSYLTPEQRKTLNLGHYQPNLDLSSTLLGKEQWDWLEKEFNKPADLRIVVSSIQVLNEFSGWETWANFPHERRKLLSLIHRYSNDNILIISGDIHKAEITQVTYNDRDIVEITSSGLDVYIYPKSENSHRVGETLEEKNYGILKIQDNGKLSVIASIYNDQGEEKLTATIGK